MGAFKKVKMEKYLHSLSILYVSGRFKADFELYLKQILNFKIARLAFVFGLSTLKWKICFNYVTPRTLFLLGILVFRLLEYHLPHNE